MKAVDLFGGFGGFTEGASQAGVSVVWAADHWPLAVETHARNHPEAEHTCQDLRQADWTALPAFDLLLASPCCQPHSQASQPGRRPRHDADRATAWAVVDCADACEPAAIVVENVVDFRRWRLFSMWRECLVELGYRVDEHVLRATAHGVPQLRARLFVVASRKRRPELALWLDREPAFGPCIEWDAPGWRPISQASPGAQARIAKGRARLGSRFLTQHVTGHPGVGLDEPIRTITTKDQWAIVDGDVYRPLTVREYARAQGFRDDYWLPDVRRDELVRGLGNAVPPPMARDVVAAVAEAAA